MLKRKFVKANETHVYNFQFYVFKTKLRMYKIQDRIEVKLLGIRRFALIKETMSAKNSPTIYIQRN